MLIALLSDIHDNLRQMKRALEQAKAEGCTHLLFLGDVATTGTLKQMQELWPHEIDMVPGNNDYPREEFRACATARLRYHERSADIVLDHRHIYMTHEPHNGVLYAAESGEYDAVFFGHTHRAGQQAHGATIVANPGDIQGRYKAPSFAIYDTTAHTVRHIAL